MVNSQCLVTPGSKLLAQGSPLQIRHQQIRHQKSYFMFRNYFKTTFRNLWKNKTYSFLNILGLAVGIACAALIFLWVEDEVTFNHNFAKRNYLYHVMQN